MWKGGAAVWGGQTQGDASLALGLGDCAPLGLKRDLSRM